MSSELLRIADGFFHGGRRGLEGLQRWNAAVIQQGKIRYRSRQVQRKQRSRIRKIQWMIKKEKAVAVEDIRAVMAQKSQEGKTKEIRELLQKFGAVKLSAVKPEDYPALLKEAQVL